MKYLSAIIFQQCVRLKNLEIPERVKEIRYNAFSECSNLVGISLPNNLTYILESCFNHCLSLRKIKWNVSMEVLEPYITIQSYAFLNCRNLQKVNLSESSVYCLEEGSFSNCYNLKYVILSKKTRNIHEAAFQNCQALEYMHYDHTLKIIDPSTPFCQIDIKEINLFGENVFRNCTSLESIKIYGFQHFRKNAPLKCSNLKRISLPCNFDLHNCDSIHNTTREVQEIMIWLEITFISRELVEKALVPCVLSNFKLLENQCTEDGLIPIQVYIKVMFFRDYRPDTSDKLLENLFLFLKEIPSTFLLLL